jgi:hypothetical protein
LIKCKREWLYEKGWNSWRNCTGLLPIGHNARRIAVILNRWAEVLPEYLNVSVMDGKYISTGGIGARNGKVIAGGSLIIGIPADLKGDGVRKYHPFFI